MKSKGNTNSTAKHIVIENIGGITRFDFPLKLGVTELVGENGQGKSSSMNAAARLFGAEIPLEPRDGEEEGSVEETTSGVKLIVRQATRRSGVADVSIADVGPLAELIDPGISDPKARNAARIRALLKICRLPVTEEAIATLAGDKEVARIALHQCKGELIDDLLRAAEKVRAVAHESKRQSQAASEAATGRGDAHELLAAEAVRKLGGLDRLLEGLTPAEAEQQERDVSRMFETARVTARQRIELEQRQAEVKTSLGEKPDPSRFDVDIEIRANAVAAADQRLEEMQQHLRDLERRIAQHRETMAAARQDLQLLQKSKADEAERLRTWERQATILEQPVEGPTPAEVENLRVRLEEARDRTVRARYSAEFLGNRDAEAMARQEAKEMAQRAEILEALATTVRDRLGLLLSGTAAKGFTVVDGALCVLGPNGEALDFDTRQSEGQRVRAALRVFAQANPDGVVAVDPRFYASLDPERREELAQLCVEYGLYAITESPTNGPLAVRHHPMPELEEVAAS